MISSISKKMKPLKSITYVEDGVWAVFSLNPVSQTAPILFMPFTFHL